MKNRNIIVTTILLALTCFAVWPAPNAFGVVPAPDGGYPGFNTAEGQNALLSLTTGSANTAVGWSSLSSNIDGDFNTATGAGALLFNTADANTAFGAAALLFNTAGEENTAVGAAALLNNTEGNQNTAVGDNALFSNTEALFNTAAGHSALHDNTTGDANTAIGQSALFSNITGESNAAIGFLALNNNTSGSGNIALGVLAGTGITTTDNHIAIGLPGENGPSPRCYIGRIRGVTVANADGINVIIDSDGQLGTSNSSRRFKKDIKPMDQASEAVLALKPVTFHYKNMDTKKAENTPQFGLIAEDVAEVNPDLVVYEGDGQPLSVRYDAVNVMLLNEFLKERKKVEAQQATIAALKSTVAQQQKGMEVLTAQVKEQAAQIQKVSTQLAVSKPVTRVVLNRP